MLIIIGFKAGHSTRLCNANFVATRAGKRRWIPALESMSHLRVSSAGLLARVSGKCVMGITVDYYTNSIFFAEINVINFVYFRVFCA